MFIISDFTAKAIVVALIVIYLASITLIAISERNKNNGRLTFSSLSWIVFSIIFPLIVPILYFMTGNLMLKRH